MADKLAIRFKDEDLGLHWRVDDTKESFERLLYHLEIKTNMKPYFEEGLRRLNLMSGKDVVVADIGAGNCWTSAIIAGYDNVKRVYAVDPSRNRLKHADSVIKHFNVREKVELICGTFLEPKIPEQVDYVILCGSLHHCYDEQMCELFQGIQKLLKPGGAVLVANEHYVDFFWLLRRFLSYVKHFNERPQLYYYPLKNLRKPDPFGGEHWRTKKELMDIFDEGNFDAQFYEHREGFNKDNQRFFDMLGWHYYFAVLKMRSEERAVH